MKKISVIIPCYNAQKYIDRCMDCLQKQTIGMENLEIILVNDGSTDATLGKLMLYEQKYPEQILLVNCEKIRVRELQKISESGMHLQIILDFWMWMM